MAGFWTPRRGGAGLEFDDVQDVDQDEEDGHDQDQAAPDRHDATDVADDVRVLLARSRRQQPAGSPASGRAGRQCFISSAARRSGGAQALGFGGALLGHDLSFELGCSRFLGLAQSRRGPARPGGFRGPCRAPLGCTASRSAGATRTLRHSWEDLPNDRSWGCGADVAPARTGPRIASVLACPSGAWPAKWALLDSPDCHVRSLEDRAIDLNAVVSANIGAVVAALVAALFLTVIALLLTARRARRLDQRLGQLTRGSDAASLEGVLQAHLNKVYEVAAHLDELAGRAATLEANGRRAFQRVGLVRYNPFEDTGGNQSFALALLDAEEDGFIISSLHARTGTRIYAKALAAGRSDGALSDEESEALRVARSATRGRPVTVDRTAPARGPGR
ncbi:MAG: DUF4446 family protein [Chloroflexi bacterium]|nr:MAG: DUF4446 family protein [Chloroflexota bacterium]